jgi:hypothetical protein
MKTSFTIGDNNTLYNNFYEDVAESSLDNEYPLGGLGRKWIDAVMYTDYTGSYTFPFQGDLTAEWDLIDELGLSGNKAWVSFKANWNELDRLLSAALNRNFKELWMFFQPNDPEKRQWSTCEEEYAKVIEFREVAARHGMIRKLGPWRRKCISVEIPGCRSKSIHVSKGTYNGYNPWTKMEIFP